MRICPFTTLLLALSAPGVMAYGQNEYTVPDGGGSFTDLGQWTQGGPASWGGSGNTQVDGGLTFDTSGLSAGDHTVGGIDFDYTGLTGLTTTGNAVDPVQLILAGSGSLSFSNGGAEIVINPGDGLTLQVETIFNGDVLLDTSGMSQPEEELRVDALMNIRGSSLRILGDNVVRFNRGSRLQLDGTIAVGDLDSGTSGNLVIEDSETITGAVSLVINGPTAQFPSPTDLSTVVLGNVGESTDQEFVFHGLSGNGMLETIRGQGGAGDWNSSVRITGGGVSEFQGSLNIRGDFTVDGPGTVFTYSQQDQDVDHSTQLVRTIEGVVNVSNGAAFYISRFAIAGFEIPSLTLDSIRLTGGGMFGGDAWIILSSPNEYTNLLNISDGWLVGGDQNGQGQLRISGQNFYSIMTPDSGFMITVNSDELNTADSYINWDTLSFAGMLGGVNLHVNLIGSSYLSTLEEFTMMSSTALLPDGETVEGILSTSNSSLGFDTSTSRVTRFIEIIDNFSNGSGLFSFQTSDLMIRIGADYAAPAGELRDLGNTLNGLIEAADNDPNSWQAEMLGEIDAYAVSTSAYQQALSWMMPSTQFVADRVASETMYYDVQRRNLRELAIGSRGPGMVKAATPEFYAAMSEQDAVNGSRQHPEVIVNPSSSSSSSGNDDVFHSLYLEGYARRDSMNQISFVPGYKNSAYGVEGGWGIALSDGITIGLSAGWERNKVTLDQSLGTMDLDGIRVAPFFSWSGLSGNTEQYAILSVGGGYNYGSGTRDNVYGDNRSIELHGWEVNVSGTVGTRVPLSETLALQPEASLRYAQLHFDGTETQAGQDYDYNGDDFMYFNSRLGVGVEWFATPSLRATTRCGYQTQYYNWGTATWTLPMGQIEASESAGSGTINQFFTGFELEWAPSWDTALNIRYDGAFGDATQNSISGGFIVRF